ncbi:MAG: TonB-dependent receptor [Gallionellaceae bacterium]|jgi:TonB-dependent receptor
MKYRLNEMVFKPVFCGILAVSPLAFAEAEQTQDISGESAYDASQSLPVVLVVGKRASLVSVQEIKRERIEIVDAIVADDINKLPDFNVTDALSRVTGVQILRDRGEGSGVAIRGLTQMETQLNGREVFTAGTGRNIDFADIPSEMVAGIDIYKTSSAEHIEGGIGGTVDMRTRRPFDFADKELSVSARAIYGDLAKKSEPQFAMLASTRWQTEGGDEFGFLLNAAVQKRAWREDQKGTGSPTSRSDILSGQTIVVPNGTSETTSVGYRERTAVDAVLQWRPSPALELYAEGSYAKFKTIQDSYQINASTSPTFVAGSPTLFPGTNDLRSITWTNAPVSILSFARDTLDETRQIALGGIWKDDSTTIKADLSRTDSYNNLFFSGTVLGTTAANFSQDVSTAIPTTGVTGTDMNDPANFQYKSVMYRVRPFNSDLRAFRLDGEELLDHGFFQRISAGLRVARRTADNAPGLIFGDTTLTGVSATSMSGYTIANPYGNFFPGSTSIGNYLVGDIAGARDAAALRNTFGITAALPTAGNPLSVWHIQEGTQAAYLRTDFGTGESSLDGNAGLRVVRTQENVSGTQSVPSASGTAPIDLFSSYIDYLPSANLRYKVSDGLYLRSALSKTITRMDFDKLSPSISLVRNTVTPSLNQGSAGNPSLRPIRADNYDLAVERYFNETTSVYLTGFFKRVDGFITTVSSPEIYDGETYQVSRPQNSTAANVKGAEIGYQQFYDFLPGWMKGLGMQANYTYVESDTPSSVLGRNVPLQNLSKHSYNIVGMYEKGDVSARIAYNWRDKFLSGISNIVGVGALPVYTKAYGWLDASLGYKVNDTITLALEATNLLRTVRSSYYGDETRPQSVWINDRQLSAMMTVGF